MGKKESYQTGFLFILAPALMLILSYFLIPYPFAENVTLYLFIPMFIGLFLLLFGFIARKKPAGNLLKIAGWLVFAFYWSTQPTKLYVSEGNDIFNGVVCVIGVFVLCYLAYHEWLSYVRKENISCLSWIAGASALAGIIYFGVEQTFLADWLTEVVAGHSAATLDIIIGNAYMRLTEAGPQIIFNGEYTVTIIFACTAIQAMVIFVGMIIAMPKIKATRKGLGLAITLIPIYFLNLLRNAMVAFLLGNNITDFFWAHNVLSKIGALITLIVLLVILIKFIPEILDEIFCLVDLYKREGPIERGFKKLFGSKK